MLPRVVCKYGDDPAQKYGPFPPALRFAVDSIPTEMDNRKVTLNDIGSGGCVIKGTSQDLTKRVCTIHLCVRVEGEQIIDPYIILRSSAPSADRRGAPGITRKNVNFKGERAPEASFYPAGIEIRWDEKAWLSEDVASDWAQYFVQKTEHLLEDHDMDGPPYIGLQQDGLGSQNMQHIRKFYWFNNVFIVRPPGQCTDVLAMIDDEIGHGYKHVLNEMLWSEMVENPDMRCFLNEKLSESDKRILMVIYGKKAWDKTKVKAGLFKKIGKRMGFYNCRCGCENHLVKVGRLLDYSVPAYGTPKVQAMSLAECLNENKKLKETARDYETTLKMQNDLIYQ